MQLATAIPLDYRIQEGDTKYVLRKTAAEFFNTKSLDIIDKSTQKRERG